MSGRAPPARAPDAALAEAEEAALEMLAMLEEADALDQQEEEDLLVLEEMELFEEEEEEEEAELADMLLVDDLVLAEAEAEEAFAEMAAMDEMQQQQQLGYGSSFGVSSASSAFFADDSSFGLTPYFDPFFSMFGAFSAQLPSLVVMQVNAPPAASDTASSSASASASASASSSATTAESLAALEQRIEQLEQSNLLLASDFTTNAEAFWDVCTTDVLGLCDVNSLQQLPCFPSQTAMAAECLAGSFSSVQLPECRVGVERMTTWYQVHEADVSAPPATAAAAAGGAGGAADAGAMGSAASNGYYFQYYDTLDNFFSFFFCFLMLIFLLRCCAGCVALRRRAVLRRADLARRAAAAARARARGDEEEPQHAGAKVAACEEGERGAADVVVRGVAVTPERQAAKTEPGVYYL